MVRSSALAALGLVLALVVSTPSEALVIKEVAHCQARFARAGARFAFRVIKANLKCSIPVSQCQIECEEGVFGPPCDSNPPPCCDPDDVSSNGGFERCMDKAQSICDKQAAKIAIFENLKKTTMLTACFELSDEEVCGGETPGLNYAILNAGCQALDPGFTCNLVNLIECVGGPLERQLADEISALIHARAGEAISTLGIEAKFPGIPRSRKGKGEVAAGMVDVWAIDGFAGDKFTIKIKNRNDNGDGMSGLLPVLSLLAQDGRTRVADTTVVTDPCPAATECGSGCPQFTRSLPFTGTFYIEVGGISGPGCTGGTYKLLVNSPHGSKPTLARITDSKGRSQRGALAPTANSTVPSGIRSARRPCTVGARRRWVSPDYSLILCCKRQLYAISGHARSSLLDILSRQPAPDNLEAYARPDLTHMWRFRDAELMNNPG
jgi:hypothetical protein